MVAGTDPVFRPPSAVARIAQHLREAAHNMSEGDYLGSEQSLAREHHVSGPTLRQAIRLLEHEGLIKVRRGVRGGYYVGRANIDALTRAAASYLQGNIGSFAEIREMIAYLIPFAVDRILSNERACELRVYLEPFHDSTSEEFIQRQMDYMKLVIVLTNNTPLQFFLTVLLQIVAILPLDYDIPEMESNRPFEKLRAEFARAIIDKDRERAIAAYAKANSVVMDVIERHLQQRSGAQEKLFEQILEPIGRAK